MILQEMMSLSSQCELNNLRTTRKYDTKCTFRSSDRTGDVRSTDQTKAQVHDVGTPEEHSNAVCSVPVGVGVLVLVFWCFGILVFERSDVRVFEPSNSTNHSCNSNTNHSYNTNNTKTNHSNNVH